MKNIILIITLLLLLNTISFAGDTTDSWYSSDKAYHLLGSMMSTVLITKTGQVHLNYEYRNSKMTGAGITFSIGFFKEFLDRKKPGNIFSWKDLTADLAGIACAFLIMDIK